MIELNQLPGMCKDQWIKYRWNRNYDNPYPEHDFEIYFQPKKITKIVPMDIAARNAIEDICNTYKNKKIYLAMSGGVDSEYIARIMIDMKINFVPIILEVDTWNKLDVWWAYRWCKKNNVDPYVLKISLSDLLLKSISHAKKYCTRKPIGPTGLNFCAEVARQNKGVLITGTGSHELYIPDPIMTEEANDLTLKNKIGYVFSEADLLKHLLMPDMPCVFYNWTPEITLAYIAARNPDKTTEENRFGIFNCLPRPKMGEPGPKGYKNFSNSTSQIEAILTYKIFTNLRFDIGISDSFYLGTKEQLINLFTNYENI